jgi:putative transposase
MAAPYLWRKLTPRQREELLQLRKLWERPWHSPPHRPNFGRTHFLISAACFNHESLIGVSRERMDAFSKQLLETLERVSAVAASWCVLPNHYHVLVETENILKTIHELGRLHGRASFAWNKEEQRTGRKVFFGATERAMRTERHYWASLNYVHNNPVHHGYVQRWQDWPWSSATEFLERTDRSEAERIWREYPVLDYGEKWDAASS